MYSPQEPWRGLSRQLWAEPLEQCLVHRKCSAEVGIPALSGLVEELPPPWFPLAAIPLPPSLLTCPTFEPRPGCRKLLLGHHICPPWCNARILPRSRGCQHLAQGLQAGCLCISVCFPRIQSGPVGQFCIPLEWKPSRSPAQGLVK